MSISLIAIVTTLLLGGRETPDLIDDPIVRSFCRDLAGKSVSDRTREHGAFVVRTSEGLLYFVAWPPSGEKDVLRWHGEFPKGTIAILHTHPAWQRDASELDMRTARRARIPVYVITIFNISKTTGEGSEVVLDWKNSGR